jgi:urocanate hydratase
MMYGQMTAGSWIYIGTQGNSSRERLRRLPPWLTDTLAVSSAASLLCPAAWVEWAALNRSPATLNGAVFLGVDVDPARIDRRVRTGYCDRISFNLDEALQICEDAREQKQAVSVGLVGNCAEVLPELVRRGVKVDVVTDQTSAHDPLNGYVPEGLSLSDAEELRQLRPDEYVKRSKASMANHVSSMLALKHNGAVAFDYGNNIRKQALDAGCVGAFEIPGFVPEYIRPLFCEGKGPFRWVRAVRRC